MRMSGRYPWGEATVRMMYRNKSKWIPKSGEKDAT